MDNTIPFRPLGITPHAILAELNETLPDIEELYVVVKTKDGTYNEMICGEVRGLSFSIVILQKYLIEAL